VSSRRSATSLALSAAACSRDSVLRRGLSDCNPTRKDVALRYLKGAGIEIGALDYPLRCHAAHGFRYVDYLDELGLRQVHNVTLQEGRPLVVPDVVDDGARLELFSGSFANFFSR